MSNAKETKELAIPLKDLQQMAKSIAASKMFGVKTEDEAVALMLLCQSEGLHPVKALKRYHIVDGKPAMRADAMQGEFEARGGAILFHARDDKECSATFFLNKNRAADGSAVARAKQRYAAMREGKDVSELAEPGELTIIRTLQDAVEKRVAMSYKDGSWRMKHVWTTSPRQMLHARCMTEGIRAIDPGLVAGIYIEDEIVDIHTAELIDGTPDNPDEPERVVRQAIENRLEGRKLREGESYEVIDAEVIQEADDSWQEIECHLGKANGNLLGYKIKELPTACLKFLRDKMYPAMNPATMTEKDRKLFWAVEKALDAQKPETPAPEPAEGATQQPATVPETSAKGEDSTPQPEKAATEAPVTFDWRTEKVPFECRMKGDTLGSLTDGHLRVLQARIIAVMDWSKATPEERRFEVAFQAALEETGALLTEQELREGLRDFAQDNILTLDGLTAFLEGYGLKVSTGDLNTAPEEELRMLYCQRGEIRKAIQEANKIKTEPKKRGARKKANK